MSSPRRISAAHLHFSQPLLMSSFSPPAYTGQYQHRDSFVHQRELESAFCQDLVCCNQQMSDLHELLHHYEEVHGMTELDERRMSAQLFSRPPMIQQSMSTQPESQGMHSNNRLLQPKSTPSGPLAEQPFLLSNQDLAALENYHAFNHRQHDLMPPSPSLSYSSITSADLVGDTGWHGAAGDSSQPEKPYKCDVPGCEKSYKNPNGLKYHRTHGHREPDGEDASAIETQKPYKCEVLRCTKRYKNLNGLKYHMEHSHASNLQMPPPTIPAYWSPR